MKTILLPNDLSPVAENAFAYAVDFAMAQPEKIKLILLHVFDTSLANPVVPVELMLANVEAREKRMVEDLERMAAKYLRATGLNCAVLTTRGFVENEIASIAAEYKADYIFMGTKGAKGIEALLYGSNTSNAIAKAPCPVLAIPEHATFSRLRNIVFASNFEDRDLEDIRKVIPLAKLFSAKITLMHLSEKEEEEVDMRVLDYVKAKTISETGYYAIENTSFYAPRFAKGIEKELKDLKASLLVMAPRKRTFLQNLFGASNTRKMVMQTQIPLLALPIANQEYKTKPGTAGKALKNVVLF